MTRWQRWRHSLRARVVLAVGLLLTLVLVVSALALARWTRRSLTQGVEADLLSQIGEVGLLARHQQLPPVLRPVGVRTGEVQVFDSQGNVVASSAGVLSQDRLDVIAAPTGSAEAKHIVDGARLGRSAGEPFLVVARSVDTPTGPFVIYGASSLRSADQAVHSLTIALLGGIPVILIIAALLLWGSVGRALSPVERMRAEVEDIEATSLDRRISAPNTDNEIDRLAHTLNGLLDRLETALRRERRFAADASHELRSPLAAARTQLEVGLAYPDRTNWTETATDVLIEIERLDVLARDLLRIAKSDAGAHRRDEPLDLGELVSVQLTALPASDASVEYTSTAGALPILGDRDLLVRVIRNLLTNAQRHAATRIWATDACTADSVTVRVSNDGPPIPLDQLENIFEPFARLDDARGHDEGGAGLGLAIARRIVEDHGGKLTAESVSEGATFVVQMPRAPARDSASPATTTPRSLAT
jgi:signal transduction histidine kinase